MSNGMKTVMADATYKLVWENFPILIVSRVDEINQGHPICLAISNFEKAEDFNLLISSINVGC